MSGTNLWRGLLLVALPLFVAGCGGAPDLGDPAKVTGQIKRKGKPMANLVVAFTAISEGLPGDKRQGSGKTDGEGRYTVENLFPAEYMVTFVEDVPPAADGMVSANPGTPALAKYANSSPLRFEVAGTDTEFSYDIPE